MYTVSIHCINIIVICDERQLNRHRERKGMGKATSNDMQYISIPYFAVEFMSNVSTIVGIRLIITLMVLWFLHTFTHLVRCMLTAHQHIREHWTFSRHYVRLVEWYLTQSFSMFFQMYSLKMPFQWRIETDFCSHWTFDPFQNMTYSQTHTLLRYQNDKFDKKNTNTQIILNF